MNIYQKRAPKRPFSMKINGNALFKPNNQIVENRSQ